jgi:hypothetical protein
MEARGGTGKRMGWSSLYQSDRPRDILGLTEEQEATLSQAIGFSGKNPEGEAKQANILVYPGTADPTLTNYAATPVGTIIIAPLAGTHSKIYIHKSKSTSPVVGDWEVFTAATAT